MVFFLVFMLMWFGIPYVVLAVFALDLAWAAGIPGLWWFWQLNICIPAAVWWFALGLAVFNRLPDPNEAGQRAVSERRRRNPPPQPPRRP